MADIIPFESRDYLQEMRDRVTMAFEGAPVFDKFLQLLVGPEMELQEAFRQLMQERSIDTAVGAQLDIIGDIVGQPRILINTDLIPFFGYRGYPTALGYGDKEDLTVGGYYWDKTKPQAGSVTLNDEQYRVFIKAKILKNITRATPEDVINFISFVFGVEKVEISTDGNAEATILVSDDIGDFERTLLTYYSEENGMKRYFVPKTLGVGYNFGGFVDDNFFSFLGVEGGKGYGNLQLFGAQYDGTYKHNGQIRHNAGNRLEPGVGGVYASLF